MYFRSHVLNVAGAILLAGGAWAQVPNGAPMPQNQPGNPQYGAGRTPDGMSPRMGTPGTLPEQQQDSFRGTSDKRFVREAAEGSLAEVELGKMAQEKGVSDAVKAFGKRMVDDHSRASEELKQAASKANIEVPNQPPQKVRKTQEKLAKLTGTDFDRAYAKLMLKDHKNDVKEFDNEARNGNVPEVKGFAAKTLPALQEHLKLAQQLDASTKPEVMGSKDKSDSQTQ